MTSPEKLATPESLRELTERLSRLAVGTVEWRVADPETRAYCIAFTRREELDPENAAREWLKKHIAEFPRSPHANKVVVQVRCFSELERAALEAVAALRLATQRQGEGERRFLSEKALADSLTEDEFCKIMRAVKEQVGTWSGVTDKHAFLAGAKWCWNAVAPATSQGVAVAQPDAREAALEQAANLVECEYAADATQGRRLAQIAQHIRDLKNRKPL